MASRPNQVDLRLANSTCTRPLRSPRLHVAGEVPPALSPLDAFAAQSRLLSRQLEESAKNGNRVSRLPPLTTESPLVVQGRSEYYRSLSYDSSEDQNASSPRHAGLGLTTEIEYPVERPVSMHPRMSHVPPTPDEPVPVVPNPFKEGMRGRTQTVSNNASDLYGARREQSPAEWESELHSAGHQQNLRETSPSHGPFPISPDKLTKTTSHDSAGLVPPRPVFPKRSSSMMSVPLESSRDDAMASSLHSRPRKLSSAGGFSGQVLPSPVTRYQRSPSISSDASIPLPRPAFNFSRPRSRAETPALEPPTRQASSDSHPSFILADDTAHTPISVQSDGFAEGSVGGADPMSSNNYSRYSLPRGKPLQHNAAPYQDENSSSSIILEAPPASAGTRQAPPSPPTRPSSSSSRYQDNSATGDTLIGRPSLERSKLSTEMSADAEASRPSTRDSRASSDVPRGRTLTSSPHEQSVARARTPVSVSTSDSASTVKPQRSQHSGAPAAAEISAEEHLAKGIKCHEEGSVKESTYHLRLAAHGGDPTGMLLYALACRHGWGMRPNQKEGVQWLRKAADIASAEIAEDEDHAKDGKKVDYMERKTRKAQFALSIYELGVSHMNGWGIEQDKALALRCFEISGNWGDVDALAEAGFCYAQGIGCKKDLKKSAKFYRMAEAKGMSMPGNSWIHKSKYTDDASSIQSSKARSKSKSRGIFSKK
ncbi:hypothetical protein GGS21DRAFT_527408 [Xylaria nigripes]|nr:hypothetical protein GGS21DRAFT_527408 [Xylaria nigripes]